MADINTTITKDQLILKPKYQIFNIFMLNGPTLIWVDTSRREVDIPTNLKVNPVIKLMLGYVRI